MPKITRLKNCTRMPIELSVGANSYIRLFGKDKNYPQAHISRPVSDLELESLDVQVNLKAKAIELIMEEVG